MTITIGGFSSSILTAQPFGYEGEARSGLTARTFRVSGLLTPAQWTALVGVYNTWRDARIADEDTLASGTVGTTVSLTITDANGLSVSGLACWFADPPAGEQTGAYVSASAVLVDANQALQVLLRSEEKSRENQNLPSLGSITFGSAVVTLTAPADTRQDGPQVALTATGSSYITGALAAHEARRVQGYISSGTYANLLSWYDSTIAAVPASGSWFPIEPPSATAEVIIDGGAKSTRYNVQLTVVKVI